MVVKDVAAQRSSAARFLKPVPGTTLLRQGLDVNTWGADIVGVRTVNVWLADWSSASSISSNAQSGYHDQESGFRIGSDAMPNSEKPMNVHTSHQEHCFEHENSGQRCQIHRRLAQRSGGEVWKEDGFLRKGTAVNTAFDPEGHRNPAHRGQVGPVGIGLFGMDETGVEIVDPSGLSVSGSLDHLGEHRPNEPITSLHDPSMMITSLGLGYPRNDPEVGIDLPPGGEPGVIVQRGDRDFGGSWANARQGSKTGGHRAAASLRIATAIPYFCWPPP